MGYNILVILFSGGILALMVLLIAARPKLAIRISAFFSVAMAVAGMLIYGYGFAATVDDLVLACVRTLLCVCGMFLGNADFDAVSAAPLFQSLWAEVVFWAVHLLAFYATVSAALSTFAASFLGKVWLRMARWKNLHLIYGVGETSLAYGRELAQTGEAVIFIGEKAEEGQLSAISEMGAFARMDDPALEGSPAFLKSLGLKRGKRAISLYALGTDSTENLQYARQLLSSLKTLEIVPEQTSLIIQGREDSAAAGLQVMGERYGYGFVTVYQEPALAARLLVQTCPPCNTISFDENGVAKENFEAMVVGFGQLGQAVLKNLIMNGQFAGSHFRATVVAPDCDRVRGTFTGLAENLTTNYEIEFCTMDARSGELYDLLRQRGNRLRYLVLCTGSEKQNREISDDLTLFLERHGMEIAVFQCSHEGIHVYDREEKVFTFHSLYRPQVLNARTMDEMAMVINHFYQGAGGTTPVKDWMRCDYFSRMSCRASADFLGAMLRMAGRTPEQVAREGWELPSAVLETMSITEHLRWCAFHYCMGFSAMTEAEYAQRAARYLAQVEAGEKPLRIGKNMENRTHACLIPWEELDELSARENAITGKRVDYKAMDRDNVLAVPKLLEIRSKQR